MDAGGRPPRQRRSHNKSRNGCQRCKSRRIKCGEERPACGNCLRLSIPCDFTPASECADPLPAGPLVKRRRGRPVKDWRVVSFVPPAATSTLNASGVGLHSPLSSSSSLPSSVLGLEVELPLHLPWTVDDMELLYHYQSHTSLTLGDTSMWRDKVPRLAFRHHCILHLILAMAALHQISIHPASAARFEERAKAHLDVGTRQATTLLPSLDESNCTMLYVATVLICSCTFAKGPGPGHLLVIAEGDEVAWWELFRGVRIVVDRIGIAAIFSGELGPLPSDDTEQSSITGRIDFDYIEWEDAVRLLSELVAQASEESMGPCQQAVSVMTWCYKHTFGISVNAKRHVEGRFERVMTWLYFLPDEFVSGLKTLEPAPLVILAYFTPLLQLLEGFWYMRGWAAHVLHGINGILPPAYGQWLQWPNEAVRLGQRCIEESDRGTKSRDLQHIIPTVN